MRLQIFTIIIISGFRFEDKEFQFNRSKTTYNEYNNEALNEK